MNALRLCLGTLTVLPVRAPRSVDRRTAGRAMVLAPMAGLLLGVVAALAWWLVSQGAPALPAATISVAVLAATTRGLHLDGLADVADGLGSGRPAAGALDVMRRSDIGPFGVATLVLALLMQVGALASMPPHSAAVALVVGAVASRVVLPLLCLRGVPAARPEGLGHLVSGTVTVAGAAGSVLLGMAACALGVGVIGALGAPAALADLALTIGAGVAGVLTGCALGWHCVRRLGGITGDVLGACVEVAFTTALLVSAFR